MFLNYASCHPASIKIIYNELLRRILGFYQEMSSLLVLLHVTVWLTIILQISTEVSFPLQCPHQSHKSMRSRWYCKTKLKPEYICLIDTEYASSMERCVKKLDYAPPGQNYVWTGGLRNLDCKNYTFQPFALWQNESENCLFEKSHCIDEGQLLFSTGTTETDSFCRCDHTRYYSFVSPPKHGEFCEPSKEDCSCYIKQCAYNEQLNSGYECINSSSEMATSPATNVSINPTGVFILSTFREETKRRNLKWSSVNVGMVILIMIILLLIGGITLCCFLQKHTENYDVRNCIEIRSDERSDTLSVQSYQESSRSASDSEKSRIVDEPVKIRRLVYKEKVGAPVIQFHDDINYAIAGRTVSLKCTILSKTTLHSVVWTFAENNGSKKKVIDISVKQTRYSGGKISDPSLVIKNLTPEDEGIYTCCATNDKGSSPAKEAYLKIEVPKPLIMMCSSNLESDAGESVCINCSVESPYSQIESIKWGFRKEDDKEITSIEENALKYVFGGKIESPSLTIHDITPNDAGQYNCQATNADGKSSSQIVTLKVTVPLPTIYMERSKSDVTLSNIIIQCAIKSPCSQVQSVEWKFKHDSESEERILDTSNNQSKYYGGTVDKPSLTINSLSRDDAGEYRCSVKNLVGKRISEPFVFEWEELKLQKPIVAVGPSRQIVEAGTTTSILYKVISPQTPLLQTQWIKQRLRRNTEINLPRSAVEDGYIVLTKLKPEDAGRYFIKATNSVGSTESCFADIEVIGSLPIIFPASITYTLEIGHTVSIVYLIVSDLDTQIVLKRKSNDCDKFAICSTVKTETLEYVDGNSKKYFVTICSLETNEPGIYFCDGTNVLGTRSSKQHITVRYALEFSEIIKIVAALDIGSMNSKIAFTFTEEYLNDERKIYTTRVHTSGEMMTEPTCLLQKNSNIEMLFGNDAKKEYKESLILKDSKNIFFFERFKAKLCKQEDMLEKTRIEDVNGRQKLCASDIFESIIKHLKEMTILEIKERHIKVKEDKILWVLTLPSEWYEREKDFFLTCCEKAGIQNSRLLVQYESKAAFIYCQCLDGKRDSPMLKDGTNHLIVDIGGGTCQLSILQRVDENEVKELYRSSVLSCAGEMLDKEIMYFFEEIVSDRVVDDLKTEEASCYRDLMTQFESAKRQHADKTPWVSFSLPVDILNKLCCKFHNRTLTEMFTNDSKVNMDIEHLTEKEKRGSISLKGQTFFIGKDYLSKVYQRVIDVIISEIRKYLNGSPITNNTALVLVGGLSNCKLVRHAIEKAFPNMTIFLADDSDFAVAKGAILFGCKPTILTTRVTRYTYGCRICPIFDKRIHNPKKRFKDNGSYRCKDVFESFMGKNQFVPIGTTVNIEYSTISEKQTPILIALYMSKKDAPGYVDEKGCKMLVKLEVPISLPTDKNSYIDVKCVFGYDKVIVEAVERGGKDYESSDFQLY